MSQCLTYKLKYRGRLLRSWWHLFLVSTAIKSNDISNDVDKILKKNKKRERRRELMRKRELTLVYPNSSIFFLRNSKCKLCTAIMKTFESCEPEQTSDR